MTLGFSQEIKGVKNFFVAKIWMALDIPNKQSMYDYFFDTHIYTFNKPVDIPDEPIKPKLHTIRSGDRWRPGMDIHMVINNRTANRFQFAPTIKCKRVQKIEIRKVNHLPINSPFISYLLTLPVNGENYYLAFQVKVDGVFLNKNRTVDLAINDGFESVDAFFEYFNTDFNGQIIHWTDLKY